MSNDQTKTNSDPFVEFHHDHHHHTILSEGFAFPTVNNFNPFMYNHPQLQNPNLFDDEHHSHFLQDVVEYNTSSAPSTASGGGDNIPMTRNSSFSSDQEGGGEEGSSKSEKDVEREACEGGGGGGDGKKSKNVKAKEKEGKKERQSRFAFMTKSEVDNLEDGYRWRKYGQKAVKNSPFPRSYYKCTTQKCSVKKRIERSYQDPSVVITTYEGQHNHHSPGTLRGNAAAMLAPSLFSPPPNAAFHHHRQDMFFPSPTSAHTHTNPTAFFTQLTDSRHHHQPPEITDQFSFLMPAAASSFLHKPEP